MTNHKRKPQKKKSQQKKNKGLIAIEKELENSFETIFRNSFDVNDENLIHAIGKISLVRNLFVRASEDDFRYIPRIKVEILEE